MYSEINTDLVKKSSPEKKTGEAHHQSLSFSGPTWSEELTYTCMQLRCSVRMDTKILHGGATCELAQEVSVPWRAGGSRADRAEGLVCTLSPHDEKFPEAFGKGAPADTHGACSSQVAKA